MAASVKPERLTERQFVNGWASAPRVRIRQARPGDVDAVAKLAPLAGPMLDPDIAAAVDGKTAGSGFRVGLRRGREAFLRHMADQFGAHAERGEHFAAYLHAALVLVAEHRDHGIVGTLIANPPATVAATYLEQVGGDPVRQQGAWISCGTGVARVGTVAVAEQARGQHLGGSLLKRCRQLYAHCGYFIPYGQIPPRPGLEHFYERHGFRVLNDSAALNLWVVFGEPAMVYPDPGERIFVRHLQPR